MDTSHMESSFNPNALEAKVALITGGTSLICQGIARVLMKHGADVAIASRNIAKLRNVAEELQKHSRKRIIAVKMDVRNVKQVYSSVEEVKNILGRIDILINGAAGNFLCPFENLSPNGFRTVMDIDVMGAFNVSKAVFDLCFSKQNNVSGNSQPASQLDQEQCSKKCRSETVNGIIINISATLHYSGTLLQSHAGAAKAAIDALTKHLAVELGPRNIRVNGISPGPIAGTEGLSRLNPFQNFPKELKDSEKSHGDAGKNENRGLDQNEMLRSYIPLQRLGTPQDIAYSALFLCLPESSLITGATIIIDGGQSLTCANFTVLHPYLNEAWKNCNLNWISKL